MRYCKKISNIRHFWIFPDMRTFFLVSVIPKLILVLCPKLTANTIDWLIVTLPEHGQQTYHSRSFCVRIGCLIIETFEPCLPCIEVQPQRTEPLTIKSAHNTATDTSVCVSGTHELDQKMALAGCRRPSSVDMSLLRWWCDADPHRTSRYTADYEHTMDTCVECRLQCERNSHPFFRSKADDDDNDDEGISSTHRQLLRTFRMRAQTTIVRVAVGGRRLRAQTHE